MRLLIIDDNPRLATLLAERLATRGFACDIAPGLEAAEQALGSASYDLLVLDLGLPDGDGLEWLKTYRARDLHAPVLVLTARGALGDRVAGLDAGADDYMSKPFETDELAARLRALMRRPGSRDSPVLKVGPLEFDVAGRRGRFGGQSLELTRREADLLELLLRRVGAVTSRAMIEERLYSFDETFTPNAVEAVVSRLRRKIEEAGGTGVLHTVRGVGYLLREPL